MNKEVKGFCETYKLTVDQFYGREVYKESLDLRSLIEVPQGFNPTISGSLYLNSLIEVPQGFNPTVGESLDLRSLKELPKGFNPTVGGSLYLNSLKELPEGFNPTVGWSLNLRSLTELPEGFNPTVGWSLDLRTLKELPEGFNPTVGLDLNLNSLIEVPQGFNPTVGWSIDLSSVKQLPEWYTTPRVRCSVVLKAHKRVFVNNKKDTDFLSWQGGKYISVDGIFTEVVSHKGNVWKVKGVAKDKIFYLITDGNNNYAHGDTLQEAKADLIYKITNRSKDDYKDLTLDSELTYEESIICYRVITGACSFGTRDYIQNRLPKRKETYTIAEIIELTNGEYGNNTFESFFTK